ncbi:MAG: hypothetical protein GXY23_10400 [Myxococcales bacterium]|nr:hypothetical protein [Myxococcales bacterium]
MTRERERGYRLAEAVLGESVPLPAPAFPDVPSSPPGREPPSDATDLARELARLRRLPRGRAEAEIAFLEERGWIDA